MPSAALAEGLAHLSLGNEDIFQLQDLIKASDSARPCMFTFIDKFKLKTFYPQHFPSQTFIPANDSKSGT